MSTLRQVKMLWDKDRTEQVSTFWISIFFLLNFIGQKQETCRGKEQKDSRQLPLIGHRPETVCMLSPIGRERRAKDHVAPFSRETVALLSGLERAACVSGWQRCGSLLCGTFWTSGRSLTVFQHGCCHNDRGECRRDGEGRVGWEMPEAVPGFLGGVSQSVSSSSSSSRLHCVVVGPRTRCTRTDIFRMFFNVNGIFDHRMLCWSVI